LIEWFFIIGGIVIILTWYYWPSSKASQKERIVELDINDLLDKCHKILLVDGKSKDDVKLYLRHLGINETQVESLTNRALQLHKSLAYKPISSEPSDHDVIEITAPETVLHSEIEFVNSRIGGHGYHFGALLGFDDSYSEEVLKLIAFTIGHRPPIIRSGENSLSQTTFEPLKGSDTVGVRAIRNSTRDAISSYPYLPATGILPFKTKKIVEWEYGGGGLEAELEGIGKDIYALGFFATDYVIHKHIYISNPSINIRLSAFALVADKFTDDSSESLLSEEFTSYLPSDRFNSFSYFDFIGKILDIKEVSIVKDRSGYLAKVKLLTDENDDNFFTIDIFINRQNLKISSLETGMRISGLLWFQAELADYVPGNT